MMGASLMSRGSDQFGWQPNALLIADPGLQTEAIAALIATTGARLVQTISLADATGRVVPARVDLVVLALAGAPADAVEGAVVAAAELAIANGAPVVAIIDPRDIDVASTAILGGDHQLLCQPDEAVIFAALAGVLWRDRQLRFNDATRDTEAARLQRLNEEVARIAETLARLTQGNVAPSRGSAAVSDRTLSYQAGPGTKPGVDSVSATEVRTMIRARRLRDQFFSDGLFEDPAWDMLLDLYAADLERSRVSVSSLCIAAAVAPTTALRWIGRMTDTGLFEREPDPFDRRRAYMVLSAKGREGMQRYFEALKRQAAIPSLV